jgi:hypothetical protein
LFQQALPSTFILKIVSNFGKMRKVLEATVLGIPSRHSSGIALDKYWHLEGMHLLSDMTPMDSTPD